MNHNGIFSLSFSETKTIIVAGDIHGDFNQLVFELCIQYQKLNIMEFCFSNILIYTISGIIIDIISRIIPDRA